MKFEAIQPPREFSVGAGGRIVLKDCGRLRLDPDEQVTVCLPGGGEWDITRKEWGFYATPSLNRRLVHFGLRAALIRSHDGTHFIWLVERGCEPVMEKYMADEGISLVSWLDQKEPLSRPYPSVAKNQPGCPSGLEEWERVFLYTEPPAGETRFPITEGHYRREILRSAVTGHFVSRHTLDLSGLYKDDYVSATYRDEEGVLKNFRRIMDMPPEKSDNRGRAKRILEYVQDRRAMDAGSRTLLDVGSGLCVFPAVMKEAGWDATALDPDPRAVEHARRQVGVSAVCADFATASFDRRFHLITFNKVAEHVLEPISFLALARRHLKPDGVVYVEVPDGEAAAEHGPEREEFFIEHWHVYSAASLALTAQKAGFRVDCLERLREPSGKFTLRAFLSAGSIKETQE